MLPAHLAENIRKQVLFYLQSTFDFRDKQVERAFTRFLEDPTRGCSRGRGSSYAGRSARQRPMPKCRSTIRPVHSIHSDTSG